MGPVALVGPRMVACVFVSCDATLRSNKSSFVSLCFHVCQLIFWFCACLPLPDNAIACLFGDVSLCITMRGTGGSKCTGARDARNRWCVEDKRREIGGARRFTDGGGGKSKGQRRHASFSIGETTCAVDRYGSCTLSYESITWPRQHLPCFPAMTERIFCDPPL